MGTRNNTHIIIGDTQQQQSDVGVNCGYSKQHPHHHMWHTTTTLTKCVVVWCCFEYPQQHILTKCVVVWCCGCCFEYPQQHILTKCVVVWCCGCCFEYPQHILLKCVVVWCCGCCFEYPQQYILTKWMVLCVVTPTTPYNNTFVVVGTRNNTHNTVQQHISTTCVVVWCCGCCDPQHHSTHFVKMCCCHCCGYSKQHPQHHTTHFVNVVGVCVCVTYGPS